MPQSEVTRSTILAVWLLPRKLFLSLPAKLEPRSVLNINLSLYPVFKGYLSNASRCHLCRDAMSVYGRVTPETPLATTSNDELSLTHLSASPTQHSNRPNTKSSPHHISLLVKCEVLVGSTSLFASAMGLGEPDRCHVGGRQPTLICCAHPPPVGQNGATQQFNWDCTVLVALESQLHQLPNSAEAQALAKQSAHKRPQVFIVPT